MDQIPSHQKSEMGFVMHHVGNFVVAVVIAMTAIALAVHLASPEWGVILMTVYKWIGVCVLIVVAVISLLFAAVSISSLRKGRDGVRREFEEYTSRNSTQTSKGEAQ